MNLFRKENAGKSGLLYTKASKSALMNNKASKSGIQPI